MYAKDLCVNLHVFEEMDQNKNKIFPILQTDDLQIQGHSSFRVLVYLWKYKSKANDLGVDFHVLDVRHLNRNKTSLIGQMVILVFKVVTV